MVKRDLLPLQAECTMLFQANPHMLVSVEGMEDRLGRKEEKLSAVFELLVKQGILQIVGSDSSPLYRYKEPMVITELNEAERSGNT